MKAYEGPELPRSEIAVLHAGYRHGETVTLMGVGVLFVFPLPVIASVKKHQTLIVELDGKKTAFSEAHILPGQHSAKVRYIRYPDVAFCFGGCFWDYQTRDLSIDFTAKAGHEYRIPAERRGERNWIWVEDITESKTNGEVVVEVVAGEKPPEVKIKGKEPATSPE